MQLTSTMTGLGLARACTVFKRAHLSGSIITPGTKDIWRGITNISLRKSRHEPRSRSGVGQSRLLKQISTNTLVVAGDMGVVLQH